MKRAIIVCFLLSQCVVGFGQLLFAKISLQKPLTHSAYLVFPAYQRPSVFSANPLHINCQLPKGAIFCRMEDALYKKFNIWIKFRMGNDDRYSN